MASKALPALLAVLAACAVASGRVERRSLLAAPLTVAQLCRSPPTQTTIDAVAEVLTSGPNAISDANAQALTQAGNRCCGNLGSIFGSVSAKATAGGQGDTVSKAAANAAQTIGVSGCAKNVLVKMSTDVKAGPKGCTGGSRVSYSSVNGPREINAGAGSGCSKNADGSVSAQGGATFRTG